MTKRIEGYVDERAAGPTKDFQWTKVFVLPLPIPCYPAVLFIGENGQPPKVYTEEDLKELIEALEDIHSNYDCDEDAHKYRTRCRRCTAEAALAKYRTP